MRSVTTSAERKAGPVRLAAGQVAGDRPGTAGRPAPGVAPFNRFAILVGGVLFAVLMAFSAWYGFTRDELYFFDTARHLQASYVDQPVLTPLIAWVSLRMFGLSVVGLHLWPALAGCATVVVSALTAREFEIGRAHV